MRDKNVENSVWLQEKRKELIYRHIAWMYAHRSQLLQAASWEQVATEGIIGKIAESYTEKFGLGIEKDDIRMNDLNQFITDEELNYLKTVANPATQLLNRQSHEIMKLKDQKVLDQFEHQQLEELLREFFTLQGRNERIKKFPFPRDYSTMSRFFVYVFVFLLPFSLIPEMIKEGNWAFWLSVPIATLIGLLFMIMEDLGDYNENPFMGTPNAMPMLSISRAIEIDLRQILQEENVPNGIESKEGVLM